MRIIMTWRTALPMILEGIAIVVVAFLLTTLALKWALPSTNALNRDKGYSIRSKQSENLLWPSEGFRSPNWVRLHVAAIEPAAAKAPNGKMSASKLVESAENARHFIYVAPGGAHPGAIHTFSLYVKRAERPTVMLEIRDNPQKRYGTAVCNLPMTDVFNVSSGAQVTKQGDIVGGGVDDVGNDWYRCWAAMPFDLANVVLGIEIVGPYESVQYGGDGHSGVLIWGAQFELGTRPSAYAQTMTGPLVTAK
jgi:hypothetical protein